MRTRQQVRTPARHVLARGLIALLSVLAASSLATAQPFDPQLVARAKAEGRLVFYTGFSGNQLYGAIKKGYEEAFGIPVDMLIGRSSEIHERLRVEVASGRPVADALIHSDATTRRMLEDGLLAKGAGFAGAARLAVPDFAPGVAAPIYTSGYSLMVNTNLVKAGEEPSSWRDLLEPRWAGKILADDPRALGAGHVFFSASVEKFGADFHRALASQKIVFGRDLGVDQMRVARGEFALRYPQSLANMRDLKGLPLRFVIPKEGLVYVRASVAVVNGSPRPNAARLFAEYLLSPATQNTLAGFGLVPVVSGDIGAADPETRDLVQRARANLMGGSRAETQDAMLALAREIYK